MPPCLFTRKNEKKAVKSTPSDAARKIAVGAGLTALSSRHTISCNLYHVQWPVNIDTITYVMTTNQKARASGVSFILWTPILSLNV